MSKPPKKLAQIKTKETESSVDDFISAIEDEAKRKGTLTLLKVMKKATKDKPKIWGTSIIGFGKLIYTSPSSGRQVEWFKIGFSPRKANFSIHMMLDLKMHAGELKSWANTKRAWAVCTSTSWPI